MKLRLFLISGSVVILVASAFAANRCESPRSIAIDVEAGSLIDRIAEKIQVANDLPKTFNLRVQRVDEVRFEPDEDEGCLTLLVLGPIENESQLAALISHAIAHRTLRPTREDELNKMAIGYLVRAGYDQRAFLELWARFDQTDNATLRSTMIAHAPSEFLRSSISPVSPAGSKSMLIDSSRFRAVIKRDVTPPGDLIAARMQAGESTGAQQSMSAIAEEIKSRGWSLSRTSRGTIYKIGDSDNPESGSIAAAQERPPAASVPGSDLRPSLRLSSPMILEEGTPVKMRLRNTISSATAQQGDTVDFEVLEEVRINNLLVIPVGATAWATVTQAEHKKRMGRGGRLDINIDSVRLANGQKAALRVIQAGKAGGHVGAMTGAIVATSLVFWPAAPLFLFMHGKDMTVPKGTNITAYINGNIPLERAQFEPLAIPEALTASTTTDVNVSSTPPSAEIELDGAFVGTTPSLLKLEGGDHTIKLKKKGFETFQRKLHVSGGSVQLNAELEAQK